MFTDSLLVWETIDYWVIPYFISQQSAFKVFNKNVAEEIVIVNISEVV